MFEDSLLESGNKNKKQAGHDDQPISFIIELIFVGILVLIPLILRKRCPKDCSRRCSWRPLLRLRPRPRQQLLCTS